MGKLLVTIKSKTLKMFSHLPLRFNYEGEWKTKEREASKKKH